MDAGTPLAVEPLVALVVGIATDVTRGYMSEGNLFRLLREQLPTFRDEDFRAAVVIAVMQGHLAYREYGLKSTDGTPWIGVPLPDWTDEDFNVVGVSTDG